jgi:hypothetical protein
MMQGIKDGKITYENGRYIVDGLGYTNTKGNKSKDYYGIIANYLYKLQGTGDEYVAPSESTVETPVSDSSVVEETPIETPSETSTTTPTETPTVEEQTP